MERLLSIIPGHKGILCIRAPISVDSWLMCPPIPFQTDPLFRIASAVYQDHDKSGIDVPDGDVFGGDGRQKPGVSD
jgi:hypothetical protein